MLPRLLVVDRGRFTLDLYKWKVGRRTYVLLRTFSVTVGKKGSRTPHGLYFVQNKSRTPDWRVPSDPDYPEDQWGKVVYHGEPGNPFKSGFISLGGDEPGIGLHDTTFAPKVGTASSHGCIRMQTANLLKIYDECKVGTPVYLH